MPMFGTARPMPDLSALSDPRPTFGAGAPQALPVDPSQLVGNTPRIPEGGFFSEGGTGRTIAGVLGDALMTMGGGRPIYGPQMARRQEFERQSDLEEKRYRRRLGDEWRVFLDKSRYERENPTPYRWESNDGSLMEVGPGGVPRKVYQDPTPKTEWIQVKDPATGALSIIPRPVGGAPAPALPPVLTDDDWGGAGPGGPRPFP